MLNKSIIAVPPPLARLSTSPASRCERARWAGGSGRRRRPRRTIASFTAPLLVPRTSPFRTGCRRSWNACAVAWSPSLECFVDADAELRGDVAGGRDRAGGAVLEGRRGSACRGPLARRSPSARGCRISMVFCRSPDESLMPMMFGNLGQLRHSVRLDGKAAAGAGVAVKHRRPADVLSATRR